jgi:hypothetical protein
MRPSLPSNNSLDLGLPNPISLGKPIHGNSITVKFSNLIDLLVREFSIWISLAPFIPTPASSFARAILIVIRETPKKEMLRIYTMAHVALMQNAHALRDWALGILKGDTVHKMMLSRSTSPHIPIRADFVTRYFPTSGDGIDEIRQRSNGGHKNLQVPSQYSVWRVVSRSIAA